MPFVVSIVVPMVVFVAAVQDSSTRGASVDAGTRIVLRAQGASKLGYGNNRSDVIRILKSRLNDSGNPNPLVVPKGEDEIVVELSSLHPSPGLVASLTAIGQMTFYYLPDVANDDPGVPAAVRNRPVVFQLARDPVTKQETYQFYDRRTRQAFRDGFHIRKEYASIIASGSKGDLGAFRYVVPAPLGNGTSSSVCYLTRSQKAQVAADNRELTAWNQLLSTSKVVITSKDIEPTSQAVMEYSARPAVTQDFTKAGAAKMEDFTTKHLNTIMAIMLDDRVLSAPRITGVISDKGELSGGIATLADARNLAGILNSGPLPVGLEVVSIESVGAGR